MPKLNVLVAGSTGYIGIQLIKLLNKHKYVKIKYLCGNTSVGKKISYYDKTIGLKRLPKIVKFNKKFLNEIDVVFTALPNGEAQVISKYLNKQNVLIDLAADFRLQKALDYKKWYKKDHKAKYNIKNSIYSLPEITGKKVQDYKIISCPGCYPTSILLPLIPLLKDRLIKNHNIIIDSKSGYSGAGKNLKKKFSHKNLYSSIHAYGIYKHRHTSEIDQEFSKISKSKINYTFTPHLIPTFRGMLSSIYVEPKNKVSTREIENELKRYHKRNYFVKILPSGKDLGTENVLNTNFCEISVCKLKEKNRILILSAIDNLVKGAAGQAIQNMNILFGYRESTGLK